MAADFSFPSVGIQSMTMRLRSATAMSSSPFTFDQQVYEHPGVRWEAEIKLPPLTRSDAKAVEAFLAGLRGMSKTFSMGNPIHTTTATGSISAITANTTSATGTFSGVAAGDYFQLGDHLYIVTEATSGTAIQIMPPARQTITSSTALDFTLPKGIWRLASNEIDWNIDQASFYGFTLACVEAL